MINNKEFHEGTFQVIDAYRVYYYQNSDTNGLIVIGYYTQYHAALEAAKGTGDWGGDASIDEVQLIQLIGKTGQIEYVSCGRGDFITVDLDGIKKKERDRLKKEALALLSPEHIKALGL